MRGRGVVLAAMALSLCMAACTNQAPSDEEISESDRALGQEYMRSAGGTLQRQRRQEEYEARLAAFNAQEAQRKQACFQLDAQQVELNHRYSALKSDSPMTSRLVIETARKVETENLSSEQQDKIMSDFMGACLIVALGQGDCEKMASDVDYLLEQQRLLNQQITNYCCTVNTRQDIYADMGRSFTPSCTPPSPPTP